MYTKSDIEDRIVESFTDSTIKTVATDWIACDLKPFVACLTKDIS